MLEIGILKKQVHGRSKISIYISEIQTLNNFLENQYGIPNLQRYLEVTRNSAKALRFFRQRSQ
jgi:hypothetical protein